MFEYRVYSLYGPYMLLFLAQKFQQFVGDRNVLRIELVIVINEIERALSYKEAHRSSTRSLFFEETNCSPENVKMEGRSEKGREECQSAQHKEEGDVREGVGIRKNFQETR